MSNTSFHGITREHMAALQAIAERLGYTADRGAASGKGSASALIRAIAEGELKAIRQSDFDKLESQLEDMWERRKGDDL